MSIEVGAVDHVYVAVSRPRARRGVLRRRDAALGFKKGTAPIAGEPHPPLLQPGDAVPRSAPRSAPDPHDPYAPGLHHLVLPRGRPRAQVDEAAAGIVALGVAATPPALHPEYADDYYATFFEDPGRPPARGRRAAAAILVRDNWAKLTEFEDPVRKAGLA